MDSTSEKISKKRTVWCAKDAQTLLELWEERANDLRRSKRNGHVFKEIALEMKNKFSAEEVHVKIKNFTQKYREEKKKIGASGGSPSNWQHFNTVHRIIGTNAANSAPILESFSFVNTPDASCQSSTESQPTPSPDSQPTPSLDSQPTPLPDSQPTPSPNSQPTPSPDSQPVIISSPSSPLSPLDTSASSSSGKKRNHLGEVVKMMKEQNEIIKSVVEENRSITNEIVKAIREQNESGKEFLNLMRALIDKI